MKENESAVTDSSSTSSDYIRIPNNTFLSADTFNLNQQQIQSWLSTLFESEHLSLLIGSGLSAALTQMVNGPQPNMSSCQFQTYGKVIDSQAKISAQKAGRNNGGFEDQLRVANQLLSGLKILPHDKKEAHSLEREIDNQLKNFAQSILKEEQSIKKAIFISNPQAHSDILNYLVSFLLSFVSRPAGKDRLNLFTTNYDRVIEIGADIAGIHLLDRFSGSVMPIFRSSALKLNLCYDLPGLNGEPRYVEAVARFTKLHGSVDWFQSQEYSGYIQKIGIPFGAIQIEPFLSVIAPNSKQRFNRLMIYPNAAKDRETAEYPYVDLFRDFSAAICQPNNVLVTYGYSFGDDHINRAIEDMLTIPSTHLVIISYSDPYNRIHQFIEQKKRFQTQTTVLLGQNIGNLKNLVNNYLPKPFTDISIEKTIAHTKRLILPPSNSGSNTMTPEEILSNNQ